MAQRILVQEIVPGKTVLGPEIPWEVVGVVKDEKVGNLDETNDNPGMYVSNEQSPVFSQSLVVRAAMDPLRLQQAINDAVHQVNKDQALTDMKTLEQIKTESMAGNRLNSIMLGGFAAVALLLSAIGIYGVISYSVVQRTHEIGIRAALGASTVEVMGLILKRGMLMAARRPGARLPGRSGAHPASDYAAVRRGCAGSGDDRRCRCDSGSGRVACELPARAPGRQSGPHDLLALRVNEERG